MGQKLNINELAPLLDQAAQKLQPDTLDRLRAARRTALARQKSATPEALLSRLWHFASDHGHAHHHHRSLNWAGALLLLLALLAGGWQWQRMYWHDHTTVDLAILTDDLPIHMYVD